MIDVMEAKVGDCCYFLLRNERKIKFGTIVRVIRRESCVAVTEVIDSKYHVVWQENAAWEEKELKGQKWKEPHNYHRDIPEVPHEKSPNEGKRTVHNRTKRKNSTKRTKKTNKSVR